MKQCEKLLIEFSRKSICDLYFDIEDDDDQHISNQSSLGLISPTSPTSTGMDWVTITILKMD